MQTTTFFTNLNPIIMKKYLLICAGALTTIAACKEDKVDPYAGFPQGNFTASITAEKSTEYVMPNEQSNKFTVAHAPLLGSENKDIAVTIEIEWSTDTKTASSKAKVSASIGSTTIATDAKTTLTVTIPSGQTSADFVLKTKNSDGIAFGTGTNDEAKLNFTIVNVDGSPRSGNVGLGGTSLTFKGNKPIVSAPSYAVIAGRKRTDTLWFGLTKSYYSTAPALDGYKVMVKSGTNTYQDVTSTYDKFFDTNGEKFGVAVDSAARGTWSAGDTIGIRLILPKPTTETAGMDDSVTTQFVVAPDKLTKKVEYDFSGTGKYFALLAGKEITANTAVAAALTDVVLYIDTTATRTDSTFVLKMLKSNVDSVSIAIVASTETAYDAALRTKPAPDAADAAEGVTYGTSVDSIALPMSTEVETNIPIVEYRYYAVKIKRSDAKEYYGYLRLRTYMNGDKGDAYKFSRVSMSFVYGEKRDYTKE
jgi:hypothetical protein